jgi:phosphotransferase system IIB component
MKTTSRKVNVNILRQHLGVTGIVEANGYTFAVRFAPDCVVTDEHIRKAWRENRRAFRPFDTGTGTFLT